MNSDALKNGRRLHQAGSLEQAKKMYRMVLDQDPDNPEALHWMGVLAHQGGRNQTAIDLIGKAIQISPTTPSYYFNYASALKAMGRHDEAIDSLKKAVEIDPRYFDAHNNLAIALEEQDRMDEAIAAYENACRFRSNDPEMLTNLGSAYLRGGRVRHAIAAWAKAVRLRPDHAPAHMNRANAYLLLGDFARGWAEYEWRWKVYPDRQRRFRSMLWDGSDPTGKTLLIYAEQGCGDTVQFCRYVPALARHGARIIIECQPEMVPVMGTLEGVEAVFARGDTLPAVDLHLSMLSLPSRFGTTMETIPSQTPYLSADQHLVDLWAGKIKSDGRKRVGLVWAGRPEHFDDRHRSIPLPIFAPLAQVPNVTLYSFQKGEAAKQLQSTQHGLQLIDLTAGFKDFSYTAAMLMHMDLLITVDTSVAHLAGALARPTWTLIPFAPDFRWMLDREDTPWYPTMKLFRQTKTGDWPSVIDRVAGELTRWSQGQS